MIIIRFLLMLMESIIMSVVMTVLVAAGAILIFVSGGDAMGFVNGSINEVQKAHKKMCNYVING